MKRKAQIAIYAVLILVIIKLSYHGIANHILISQYKKGQYLETQAKLLTYCNFSQSYVANYNYGNILYQNGNYEEAIAEYEKALNKTIPEKKECDVRINTTLAICQTVQVDENEQQSIEEAIEKYEIAIDILTQKRCANRGNDNGHNQNAQQLKNDIQEEIDRLKNLQENEKDDPDKNNQKKEKKTKKEVNTIEAEIQDIKEKATKAQRETEQMYENYNKDINYQGKNW